MKFVMNGACGRMGRLIIALAHQESDMELYGAVDIESAHTGTDIGEIAGIGKLGLPLSSDLRKVIGGADVVLDFSLADAVLKTASICGEKGVALVEGTTGLDASARQELTRLVKSIPCVFAPNMSVGVNLLFKLAAETASILGTGYDVEIMEVHHRFKKDAPSGTANHLAEVIAESRMTPIEDNAIYGRHGIIGERPPGEIGIHALRVGDVIGEHTVTFGTIGERIELVHKAQSRDALAKGAIIAARYVVNVKPGLYDMQDVLGFK